MATEQPPNDGSGDCQLDRSLGTSSSISEGLDGEKSQDDKVVLLQKKIVELTDEFGVKRARYKEMFLQKEEEFKAELIAREKLEEENKHLRDELNEAKSQVTIAEMTKENEIQVEREHRHHDLTKLKKQYEEALSEMQQKYEGEIQHYKVLNKKFENDLNEVRANFGYSSGNMDTFPSFSALKTLTRKLNPAMSVSNDSLQDLEDSKPKPSKYAQEDAEVLRSLVIQLEEEVAALKSKVRNSDEQLAALQNAQASLVKGNDALSTLLQDHNAQNVLTQLDEKLHETLCGLEAEKSSRADLEMYVALVNTQKTLFQEDLEKTKAQLKELRQEYENERKSHDELKETWKKANEQFVSSQNAYQSYINQLKEVLSPEQLEKVRADAISPPQSVLCSSASNVQAENISTGIISKSSSCEECVKTKITIEKLRTDLHKAVSLRGEMEEEWGRLSQSFQTKLGTLEDQVGTYEVVLQEVNASYQQTIHAMDDRIRKLSIDRDSIQKKIEALEFENDNLRGSHVAHSTQLQNEYISLPNDVMELQELVLRVKDELISVKVGKEQIESKYKFLKNQVQSVENEKRTMEEALNSEISRMGGELTSTKARLDKLEEERKKQDQKVSELKTKLMASEASSSKDKKMLEELSQDKENLMKDLHEANNKISALRNDLTNSEQLQHDLIALSKSLQMGLESIRQAETEVRWQHPDDFSQCKGCKKALTDNKEKNHCKHCGRIFCEECVKRTVLQGSRNYNVCDFCHTLLAHDSAPYFSTEPPHSPD